MNALFARSPDQKPTHPAFLGQMPAQHRQIFRQAEPVSQSLKEHAPRILSPMRRRPTSEPQAQLATTQKTSLSPLGDRERALINSVAAHQFRYGHMDEALALLQLSLRYAPEDISTLRLLAQVLAAAGDWETVDQILDAIDRLGAPKDRRGVFLRILSAFRRKGLTAAQNLYHTYLSFGA